MIIQNFDLDFLQKISSILGSFSLVVAVLTYFYKKKQDNTLAAIDQIVFFREKIIIEWDKTSKIIKENDPKYWFSRIRLDDYSLESIRESKQKNFYNQLSIFFDATKLDPVTNCTGIKNVFDKQISVLNMLEEFSLRVKHFSTQKHLALESIRAAFVQIVEQNAVAILFEREIIANNSIYSNVLELYSTWKNNFDKTNWINNLAKHNFISKKRKEEIFEKQRDNTKK
jgi:hypothetical protein